MAEFKPTPGQAAAISDRGGELLVSAAAGSGKTRVLVERLMGRILDAENPADVDRFLVITFTRAAAAELRGRIGEKLASLAASAPPAQAARLRRQTALLPRAGICTIDSFCVTLLRENAARCGLDPLFGLCDESRAAELKNAALAAVLEEAYERAEPGFIALAGSVGAGRDDKRLEALVLELHMKLQSHARPEQWCERQKRAFDDLPEDAADTPWGRELMDEAAAVLGYWRREMEFVRGLVADDEKADKAYGPSLDATLDAMEAAREAMSEGWDAFMRALPIPFPAFRRLQGSDELKETVKARRDACKKAMLKLAGQFSSPSAELLRDVAAEAPAMEALLDLALEFDAEYARRKRRRSLIDFADAEHMAARLLCGEDGEPTEFASELSRRWTEVMVDEYQDVSRVQEEIVRAVSDSGRKLFMVGDVKQSIYRFRLADPGIFLEKYERFRDAPRPEGEPRRVFLRESFRSRPEVVAAVNSAFGCLMSRGLGELDYDENARLAAALPYPGEVPRPELCVIELPGAEGEGERPDKLAIEARWAARRIRELVESGTMLTAPGGERPLRWGDIAILLRSANVSGRVWRRELAAAGVPVESGASGGFFESREVEVILSLLSLIDNPRQDVQLISAMRSALFGFTPDELTAVRLTDRDGELWDALRERAETDGKCRRFVDTLAALRDFAREAEISALLAELYARLDCYAVAAALPDGAGRARRLDELMELARSFESGAWRGLRRFNEWIAETRAAGREPSLPNAAESDAVRIMSIHQSKGLEFPVVFLADTSRSFNESDRRAAVLVHPELGLGPKLTDAERGIEYPTIARNAVANRLRREQLSEELRLLYVAMTRARERLIMSCCMPKAAEKIDSLALAAVSPMPAEALAAMRSPAHWLITAALADGGETMDLRLTDGADSGVSVRAASPGRARDAAAPAEEPELAERFAWRYPHAEAAALPSKVTATELKSLPRPDEESAELIERAARPFRMPDLSGERPLTAAERGTATHLALRYLDLAAIHNESEARGAVDALVLAGRLSRRDAEAVDAGSIAALAGSGLARRMAEAQRVWREFSFSLLRPAGEIFAGGGEDEILLQGVVDCCFEEPDGLVVVDYKTDRVRPGDAAARAGDYRGQLGLYAWAMERIAGKPVKERIVYFLNAKTAVNL